MSSSSWSFDHDLQLLNLVSAYDGEAVINWSAIGQTMRVSPQKAQALYERHLKPFRGLHHAALAPRHRNAARATNSTSQSSNNKSKRLQRKVDNAVTKSSSINEDEEVVIHVCDEARKVNKDFKCTRRILTDQMRYFKSYLVDVTSFEEVDISVHCDVQIFEWLMKYAKNEPALRPKLEVSNIVSVLISSHFLQMEELVEEALGFLKIHINEVVRTPVDLSCISSELITRLAVFFTPVEIEGLKDKRDKITTRLFAGKITQLVNTHTLKKCKRCRKIFINAQASTACSKARVFVGFNGDATSCHTVKANWKVEEYLVELRMEKLSWRQIFWKLWGLVNTLQCVRCKKPFVVAELQHCSHHSERALFPKGHNVGFYPCCDATAFRFASTTPIEGCQARKHEPLLDTKEKQDTYATLLAHVDLCTYPFVRKSQQPSLALSNMKSLFPGNTKEMTPVNRNVQQDVNLYMTESDNAWLKFSNGSHLADFVISDDSDDDVWDHVRRMHKRKSNLSDDEEEDSEEDEKQHERSKRPTYRGPNQITLRVNANIPGSKTTKATGDQQRKKKKIRKQTIPSTNRTLSPSTRKSFKMDFLRENDRTRITSLMSHLTSMRAAKPKNVTTR